MTKLGRVFVIVGALGLAASVAWLGLRVRSIQKARAAVLEKRAAHASMANEEVAVEGFSIDATEVTVARYRECVKAGACTEPGRSEFCNWDVKERDTHPINCVDHEQASAFCGWIGRRLPTGDEWQAAARGRDGRSYAWPGDDTTTECFDRDAKYAPGEARRMLSPPEGTCPVDAHPKGATERGVLGLGGNVSEWTATEVAVDSNRWVNMGASWPEQPWQKSHRDDAGFAHAPTHRAAVLGFRCATSEPPSVWAELMTELQLARSSTTAMP